MASVNATGTTPVLMAGRIRICRIQVNAALTGTILVQDSDGTASTTVATITNPTVGSSFQYWDLRLGARVTASGACDITVMQDEGRGAHS